MARKNKLTINTQKAKGVNKFLADKIAFIKFVYTALIFNLLNVVVVVLMQKNLPPELPLFYGYTQSDQQLSTTFGLFIPGVVSLAITLVNTALSILIPNDFLKKTLSIASFVISLLFLITVLKIIFLVGFI